MQVKLSREAQKDFDKMDTITKIAALKIFQRLSQWPAVSGIKHLTGKWAGHARIKLHGDWRVIFKCQGNLVVVIRIRHRSEVYE